MKGVWSERISELNASLGLVRPGLDLEMRLVASSEHAAAIIRTLDKAFPARFNDASPIITINRPHMRNHPTIRSISFSLSILTPYNTSSTTLRIEPRVETFEPAVALEHGAKGVAPFTRSGITFLPLRKTAWIRHGCCRTRVATHGT